MPKGSTFGGPASANQVAEEEEELNMEDLNDALGNPYHDLPPIVRRRVDALSNLHKQYINLQKQYHAEVRELERKYQKLYDPVFDKRSNIVSGTHEPTDAEAHVEKTEEDEADIKKREAAPGDADIKGIPQFWLTVLQNNSFVGSTIVENDEEALGYLKDIRYSELEGEEGFTITFHFAENPFFSNTVLSKTYHMEQDEVFAELEYDKATGTKIEWKSGKNLTVKQTKKKTKAKGKKPSRMMTVEEPCASFFNFFSPVQPPADEEEELGEEEQQDMQMDFEIGCIIKDKLIPFSVLWFTGEAAEYDEDDMFGDEDEDDEEDEEDQDDEDDEEEEEPAPKRGGGRGGARGPAGGAGHSFAPPAGAKPSAGAPGQPQQPECKQQ